MTSLPIVGVGGSSGSHQPLTTMLAALPADLPAAILVVVHRHVSSDSYLSKLLDRRSKLQVVQAESDVTLEMGKVYVAPPDRHLLVVNDRIRLTRGPHENRARPAIDVLFRSMALHGGSRAVGILLSGLLNDGVDGLRTIAECGGTAIVQDPVDADYAEMPELAMRAFTPQHCVPATELAPLVQQAVAACGPDPSSPRTPRELHTEVAMAMGERLQIATEERLGERSNVTCPDCGGVLWQVSDGPPVRFRCHTGHAFTAEVLADGQQEKVEEALWTAMRVLRERAETLRNLAHRATGETEKGRWEQRAMEADAQANALAEGLVSINATSPVSLHVTDDG